MTFVFQIKKWNKPHLTSVNQVLGFKVNPSLSLSLEVIAIGPSSLVELSMNLLELSISLPELWMSLVELSMNLLELSMSLLELSMSLVELSMSLLVHTQNKL